MKVLVDTNILTRASEPGHTQHHMAVSSAEVLRANGHAFYLLPQVLYKFWAVATRPKENSGLGLTSSQADTELTIITSLIPVLDETTAIVSTWRQLVIAHDVKGKTTHDARLVAGIIVHQLHAILTFNAADFRRYSGITVIPPDQASGLAPA